MHITVTHLCIIGTHLLIDLKLIGACNNESIGTHSRVHTIRTSLRRRWLNLDFGNCSFGRSHIWQNKRCWFSRWCRRFLLQDALKYRVISKQIYGCNKHRHNCKYPKPHIYSIKLVMCWCIGGECRSFERNPRGGFPPISGAKGSTKHDMSLSAFFLSDSQNLVAKQVQFLSVRNSKTHWASAQILLDIFPRQLCSFTESCVVAVRFFFAFVDEGRSVVCCSWNKTHARHATVFVRVSYSFTVNFCLFIFAPTKRESITFSFVKMYPTERTKGAVRDNNPQKHTCTNNALM